MIIGWANRFWRAFLRTYNLLPCPRCHSGDGSGNNCFCPDCLSELPLVDPGARCRGCGGELDGALALCSQCLPEADRPWIDAVTVLEYRGEARKLIADFKFRGRVELARPLGILAASAFRAAGFEADFIVPIPLHWTRQLYRGFNQTELLGSIISRELDIPLCPALRRTSRGRKQSTLGRKARLQNLRHRFAVRPGTLPANARVLLLDDVFTTGATLNAAALLLQHAGCGPIRVLTICRTPRYTRPAPS